MKVIILLASCFLLINCSQGSKVNSESNHENTKLRYNELIKQNTRGEEKYNGIYNVYHVNMTLLNSRIHDTQLDLLTKFYQWNDLQLRKAQEKLNNKTSQKTLAFISFFTPNRKHNDLNKGDSSLWKVYLDHNGQRYQAKITKDVHKFSYLKSLYPHHTRFNRSYIAEFDLPTQDLSSGDAVLTLTGSLGNSNFSY